MNKRVYIITDGYPLKLSRHVAGPADLLPRCAGLEINAAGPTVRLEPDW